MTEADWLACADLMLMWGWLVRTRRVDHYRCRQLVIACCERIRQGKVRTEVREVWEDAPDSDPSDAPLALLDSERHLLDAAGGALYSCDEDDELAALLRDLFGNPFRPVSVELSWRTPDVLSLARAADSELSLLDSTLEPTRLLLLADALDDAGCSDDSVLSHLRSPGPHARGCWAVDLILGKE